MKSGRLKNVDSEASKVYIIKASDSPVLLEKLLFDEKLSSFRMIA